MNKQTRILITIIVSLVLGGMFAYQDAQKNDQAYQQQQATVIVTDFFCGSLAGLIFYFGSGWFAKRKEKKLKQGQSTPPSSKVRQPPPILNPLEINKIHLPTTNKYPYPKIAEILLRFSVVVAGESAQIAEMASGVKINAVTHHALLQEVFAYHLNLAVAAIMVKGKLHGKDNYDQIEVGICDAVCNILKKPNANLTQYMPIIVTENREKARMYFVRDSDGLEISEEQIRAYAEKHNSKILTDIPADQMAIVYYTIRVARFLEIGRDIDKVIVWGANEKLTGRIFELQDEICQCLK
jgi:hypothetical protein